MVYTEDEKILTKLHKLVEKRTGNYEMAGKLIAWYMTYKEWSGKQKRLAKRILNESQVLKDQTRKKRVKSKYWLYAITDGQDVKLGFSSNIQKRIKSLQTSQAVELKLLWKFYTGRGRKTALNAEKCLHRHCKAHKVRGEWFKLECMPLVEEFKPKKLNPSQ